MIPALALLLLTSLACVGLLSVWAATSSRHWFVRTGTLVAVLALLLLIPAYEPLVVFVLQGAVVAAGVQGAHWWRRQKEGHWHLPRRARFSLATMLLVTVYVAIVAVVAVRLPALNFRAWQSVVLIGVVAGLATLFGLWMVHGRLVRWWLRVALGLVLSLSISLPLVWGDWFVYSMAQGYGWPRPEPRSITFAGAFGAVPDDDLTTVWLPITVAITSISYSILWLFAGLVTTGPAVATKLPRNSRWKRVLSGCTLLLLAAALVVPPAGVYYQLMTPLPIPKPEMPNPNGWDDLVAAGETAEKWKFNRTMYDYDTAPLKELTAAVKEMEPAYRLQKIGLEKQVRCPVDYDGPDLNMDSISSMRSLARALAGRGYLEKIEGLFDDAADSSLEGIRFGYALRRGGLMVDSLVGTACSGVGRWYLYGVREELSASHCSRLITALGQFERQAEPVGGFIHRDRVWSQHANGWHGHLIEILEIVAGIDPWGVRSGFVNACNRELAEMRLLRIELAIQAWRKTHGSFPESLHNLVPQYLQEIPVDPLDPDRRLLRYRRTDEDAGNGYVLYSVGYNGIDDGGIAPEEEDVGGFESGDFRLDIQYAPEPEPVEEDATGSP